MSNKKSRQQQRPKSSQRNGRHRRKAVVVIGLILCLGLTTVILAQWRATSVATSTHAALATTAPPVPQSSPTLTLSKEYIYAGGRLVATEEPAAPTPANAATFISQSVPSSMTSGQSYNVSVTMKNTGTNAWSSSDSYRLGAQNPQDNTTWRTPDRVELPSSVAPNTEVTFAFTVTAPSTAGTYNFRWQMVQDGVAWFGDASANAPVTVTTSDRINYALATNGGVATASSSYSSSYLASQANNGDEKGPGSMGDGDYWNDNSVNSFPDSLEIDFNSVKTIDEIDLFMLQDTYWAPNDPNPDMTFTYYGLTGFDVQYWDGTDWVNVPSGQVTGNNKIWRKFTFSSITTSKIKVVVRASPDGWSRITELEAWGPDAPPTGTNVALSSNGAVATASSSYSSLYLPSHANNGDRKGPGSIGDGDYWNDASVNSFEDTLEIAFNGTKTIHEIDLYCLQDTYWAPVDPNSAMTFTYYGLKDFRVQYWTGTSWADVPFGNVTNNNKVWRRFSFPDISTTKIRVWITATPDGWSRLTELEAWGN
jgi:hypothetical protein